MIRRQSAKFLATRTAFQLAAVWFWLVASAAAEPFSLLTKALTADPQDTLTGASGVALWTDAMTSSVSGLPAVKCADGKIGGALQTGQPASFGYVWPSPGADPFAST